MQLTQIGIAEVRHQVKEGTLESLAKNAKLVKKLKRILEEALD
jgi:hypothetical protein